MARRKTASRRRASPRRRMTRTRRMKGKPSLLSVLGIGYSAYSAYKEANAAGSEKINTFIYSLTGIGIGRWSDGGKPQFNMAQAAKGLAPAAIGIGSSYVLNKLPQTKNLPSRVPVMRKFKW